MMGFRWGLLAFAASSIVTAQTTLSTVQHSSTSKAGPTTASAQIQSSQITTTTTTTAPSQQTSGLSPCGQISHSISSYFSAYPKATTNPALNPIIAMACLESVPLNVQLSLKFIEYVSPFIEFQSTLAYLKDPPLGYPLPGVDIFGGLEEITEKVSRMVYQNQYEFERELHLLINTRARDFHFNLPMPLVSLFEFVASSDVALVSVSVDGNSLPDIYILSDLAQVHRSKVSLSWQPSPLVSINGQRAADFVLRAGLESQAWADPDAIYNLMFVSSPLLEEGTGNSWVAGGHPYGFASNTTTYVFANGSSIVRGNFAYTSQDFSLIDSGETLFEIVEIPAKTTEQRKRSTGGEVKRAAAATVTSVAGYPTPVVIHPDGGYTAGYFIPNSTVAVLVMTAFEGASRLGGADYVQQSVIKKFLAECRTAGKEKLIVDLQANTGGSIFNGDDAFKQIFPTIDIFGANRFRYTPLVEGISRLYSEAGVYNTTFSSEYQIQAEVDVNLQDFKTYKDMMGPFEIYGDNFTALLRDNFTDTTQQVGNDVIVSGYANETDIAPQLFAAENIVLLFDGVCGSTCSIFTELMKAQGGVRSVSVGGRPTTGPMQSVAGSKGSQVFSYGDIQSQIENINQLYEELNLTVPDIDIPDRYAISLDDPPLGRTLYSNGRFNLRNAYNSSDPSELPLQFVYQASNCRLYYQTSDIFDMTSLWKRVVDVTWGTGTCVHDSSVNADNTMPKYAYQVKPYSAAVFTNFTLNTGLPGTVYFDENLSKGSSGSLTTIGAAIAALWAW